MFVAAFSLSQMSVHVEQADHYFRKEMEVILGLRRYTDWKAVGVFPTYDEASRYVQSFRDNIQKLRDQGYEWEIFPRPAVAGRSA